MTKYLVNEYYYEDDLFSVLDTKTYNNLNEIIQYLNENNQNN